MKRIFHHYTLWEDYINGMYDAPVDKKLQLQQAIEFTGNPELYGKWMIKVVDKWPISCEQNLSDNSINQNAWIGHAACCLAIQCPEDITRQAWGYLSQEIQDQANAMAQKAIKYWHEKQNKAVHQEMGETRLLTGDSRRSAAKAGSNGESSIVSDDLQGYSEKRFDFENTWI